LKRAILFGVLLVFAAGCASPLVQSNAARTDSGALETIARRYPTWTRLFDAPHNVSMQLMLLCRLATSDEQAYLKSEHAQSFVQAYVNPAGEPAMRQPGTRKFPEGTIIVKEKWQRDESFAQDPAATAPAGLGVMFKQADGWQYAYIDETGKLTRDQKQLDHCRACHEANQARDAVFFPAVLSE
jgi:Cytochrome P460